jgi:type I restriction enzyme S subunit
MAAGWRRVRLVDLCEVHVDCVNRTAPVVDEPTPYKMIRTTNVRGGFVDADEVRYVSEEIYRKWTRRLVPQRGDVILTREAPLGEVGMIRSDDAIFLGQRLYHFRANPTVSDANFILYALMADDLQGQIRGYGSGSTVEHMRLPDIEKLEVNAPEVATQRRIGAVLAAYDDLIDNNTKRIRALEEMARAVYREWFPTSPEARHVGPHAPASSVADYINGYAFKPDDFESTGTPIIKIRELKAGVDVSTPRFSGTIDDRFRIRPGDLLFSWSADLNVYIWSGDEGWLNQHLFVVRPHAGFPRAFLFHSLASAMPEFRAMSNGATMKHIKRSALDIVKLDVATPEMRRRFSELVEPMIQTVISLQRRNRALREGRDLLLPKLLSGALAVDGIALP